MVNDTLRAEVQESLHDLFTLGRELPRGGMSRVFVATEIALRRTVVIKVLAPELAATLSAERFKREIGLAARLQHPLIVPLLSAGQAGPHLYYTMPFVDGESLRDRMQRERPMAIADVSRIVQEVAAALAYAHAEGVVHRDIKPENVMFFHGQAVVLDFGIGKALIGATTSETETLRITQAGMSLGTPTYVAPEQAAGDQGLDHRADLYALGVVAYEMLTGHPPFRGRDPVAVLQAHAKQAPEPISVRRPETPKALAELVMAMLAKRPEDRPGDGEAVVSALRASAVSRPSGGGPVVQRFSALPLWVPWAIAGVMTAAAVWMSLR
jgi:eukaryotic-like serine/threonine-protein kinase